MPAPVRTSSSLLPWLLALALLLSVSVNLYYLTPGEYAAQGPNAPAARSAADEAEDEDDEEDDDGQDRAWATLAEELRQTRQQLAACQGQAVPAAAPVER